jgi:hypothetical protein
MPFNSGACLTGGDLDNSLVIKIDSFLKILDEQISISARAKGLVPSQVKLLHPINYCIIVNYNKIYIVATIVNVGGLPSHYYIEYKDGEIDLISSIFLVERDLTFKEAFGLEIELKIIDSDETQQKMEAKKVAEEYINQEILNIDKQKRLVRIEPIFSGRDFMINENLIFMLSPFSEPFNAIYDDHIKPTVEKINSFRCLRADNIYDNKPIIEDIWKSINEAKIIIAELTGKNPNVFYEVGIAHTIGKEVILITQNLEDVPFDLRHLRCIIYEYTPRGVQLLENNLENTIRNILVR